MDTTFLLSGACINPTAEYIANIPPPVEAPPQGCVEVVNNIMLPTFPVLPRPPALRLRPDFRAGGIVLIMSEACVVAGAVAPPSTFVDSGSDDQRCSLSNTFNVRGWAINWVRHRDTGVSRAFISTDDDGAL